MLEESIFPIKLQKWLRDSGLANKTFSFADTEIAGITLDSRAVKTGFLFCAYPGEKADGRRFIEKAIEQGAAAIAYEPKDFAQEADLKLLATQTNVAFIPIPELQKQVSTLIATAHAKSLGAMSLIAVTGTNGKTSITHYLSQAFSAIEQPCGVLGTVGWGLYNSLNETSLTTPDPITVVECLVAMQKQGATKIAMEVSAHALTQGRVTGLRFDTALFTNLTQDHLDYYHDMEHYGLAKAALFSWPELKHAVINLDDPYAEKIVKHIAPGVEIIGYTQGNPTISLPEKIISAEEIICLEAGYRCTINSSWGSAPLTTRLIGRFNLSNLLACLGVLLSHSVSFEKSIALAEQLHPVAGRMQVLGGGKHPLIIVDYAHTPDALEKALLALREHLTGKLFCIFGCGGERDPMKRPIMAKIAQEQSDYVVVTQDNPRMEPWNRIVSDIEKGFTDTSNVAIIASREEAIRHAIKKATAKDVVLIAGKGHENYQIIGEQKFDYNDCACVNSILQESE